MRLFYKKKTSDKVVSRLIKKVRVRKKLSGTLERPRLSVFKSANHIYAQLIDDNAGNTICSASTLKVKEKLTGIAAAKKVGVEIAKLALAKNIKQVVFDRNGFMYHGRIKAIADGAREAGLSF